MFEECPFRELRKHETYEDYLKSPDCIKEKVKNISPSDAWQKRKKKRDAV